MIIDVHASWGKKVLEYQLLSGLAWVVGLSHLVVFVEKEQITLFFSPELGFVAKVLWLTRSTW